MSHKGETLLLVVVLALVRDASGKSVEEILALDPHYGETTLEALGEAGGTQPEIDQTCECAKNWSQECSHKLKKFGTAVVNGKCDVNFHNKFRLKRSRSDVDDNMFYLNKNTCPSITPVILLSTGEAERFSVGSAPLLLICRGSLQPKLRYLDVSDVNKVIVSSDALMLRSHDIILEFNTIREWMTFKEGAFSVANPIEDIQEDPFMPAPLTLAIPYVLEIKINNAKNLHLEKSSLGAPIMELVLKSIDMLEIHSGAVIPQSSASFSSLEILQSHSVTLQKHAIKIGLFKVKQTDALYMSESAAEIVSGGKIYLENIQNVSLASEALTLDSNVSLTLETVTLTTAGRRAVHNKDPSGGLLRHAVLTEVEGAGLDHSSICIIAENIITHGIILLTYNDEVAGCIEGRRLIQSRPLSWPEDYIIACERQTSADTICNTNACDLCNVDVSDSTPELLNSSEAILTTDKVILTEGTTERNSHMSEITSDTEITSDPEMPTLPTQTTRGTTEDLDETSTTFMPEQTTNVEYYTVPAVNDDGFTLLYDFNFTFSDMDIFHSNSSEISSKESEHILGLPMYVIIIICTAALLLILIIAYWIWAWQAQKKRDKYRLPREGKLTTFHNTAPSAHAIATSEPINTLGSPIGSSKQKGMYISFNTQSMAVAGDNVIGQPKSY